MDNVVKVSVEIVRRSEFVRLEGRNAVGRKKFRRVASAEVQPENVGGLFGDVNVVVLLTGCKENYGFVGYFRFGRVVDQFAAAHVNKLVVGRTVFAISAEILIRDKIIAATVYRDGVG